MRTGGGSLDGSRPTARWAAVALSTVCLLIAGLTACGSSSDPPAVSAGAPSNLITRAEADKHPVGSVERAFFEYWSDLQYQSWAEVAAYYDPAFRDSIGTAAIIGGKKINGSNYQQLKPAVVKVRARNDLATIFYTLQFLDGSRELTSVTWRKSAGSWQMIYDSRLDTELSQFAENRVEIEENGVLPAGPEDLSPAATRAGAAADQAQARFLEQDLEVSRP